MNETYLCHYGVLGMKWGRRKQKIGPSKDYKRTKAIQTKSIKQMSNAELKQVTERMKLVNEYQAQARQSIRNGKHWVSATLDNLGNIYVSNLTNPQNVTNAINQGSEAIKSKVRARRKRIIATSKVVPYKTIKQVKSIDAKQIVSKNNKKKKKKK